MKINFECRKCKGVFDCDVGEVTLPENSPRPLFEKNILCPACGQRSMDEVFLTEIGQMQLTEATLDDDFENIRYFGAEELEIDDDGSLDDDILLEGDCQGCDTFLPLDDMGLCMECAAKLDRDLIRQRSWAHSMSAFGVPESKLEDLRKEVIKKFGEKLELIVPDKPGKSNQKKRRRKKRKKR